MKPRVLNLAREVLHPGKWVTAHAAKILLGLTGSNLFYAAVREGLFETKTEKRDGKDVELFLYEDLKCYASFNYIAIGEYMRDWLEMIEWCDMLEEMPSVKEMQDHVKGKYDLSDMITLIETRYCRGVKQLDGTSPIPPHPGGQKGNKNAAVATSEQVEEIKRRLEAGESQRSIAADLNLGQKTVGDINTGKTWGNVT